MNITAPNVITTSKSIVDTIDKVTTKNIDDSLTLINAIEEHIKNGSYSTLISKAAFGNTGLVISMDIHIKDLTEISEDAKNLVKTMYKEQSWDYVTIENDSRESANILLRVFYIEVKFIKVRLHSFKYHKSELNSLEILKSKVKVTKPFEGA